MSLFSPFDISQYDPGQFSLTPKTPPRTTPPFIGAALPFQVQSLNPFQTPSLPDPNNDPLAMLTPEDQALAVKRGKQAYGNALLDAAFNGSWAALGTAFTKADQAQQEVTRKSQLESVKQRQDTLKFLQDNEADKIKNALNKAALAEEQRKQGILTKQDQMMAALMQNNPTVNNALAAFQQNIDNEPDADLKKAKQIKMDSYKQQIQLLSTAGTPDAMKDIMSIVGKISDEVGDDGLKREKIDLTSQLAAAQAGFPDVKSFQAEQVANKNINQLYRQAQMMDIQDKIRARQAEKDVSNKYGLSQTAYLNQINDAEKKIQNVIDMLTKPGVMPNVAAAAAARLGIPFNPKTDYSEDDGLTPEFLSKVIGIDTKSAAQKTVDSLLQSTGSTVKGMPDKQKMAIELANEKAVFDSAVQRAAGDKLKLDAAKKVYDARIAGIMAKYNGTNP